VYAYDIENTFPSSVIIIVEKQKNPAKKQGF